MSFESQNNVPCHFYAAQIKSFQIETNVYANNYTSENENLLF